MVTPLSVAVTLICQTSHSLVPIDDRLPKRPLATMPELTRVSTLNMIRPYALRSALSSSARLSFAPLIGQRLSLYLKPHKYGTHGIVSSTAASSEDDESEELFPDRPSTPLSKHCEGLRMQQRKRRLLPRSPHSGSCDITVSCEQILTAPQGQETKEN